MKKILTYHAIFKKGVPYPYAFFLEEEDGCHWLMNESFQTRCVFSMARRRVNLSAAPPECLPKFEAEELLRHIVFGNPESVEDDKRMARAIERARKLLT